MKVFRLSALLVATICGTVLAFPQDSTGSALSLKDSVDNEQVRGSPDKAFSDAGGAKLSRRGMDEFPFPKHKDCELDVSKNGQVDKDYIVSPKWIHKTIETKWFKDLTIVNKHIPPKLRTTNFGNLHWMNDHLMIAAPVLHSIMRFELPQKWVEKNTTDLCTLAWISPDETRDPKAYHVLSQNGEIGLNVLDPNLEYDPERTVWNDLPETRWTMGQRPISPAGGPPVALATYHCSDLATLENLHIRMNGEDGLFVDTKQAFSPKMTWDMSGMYIFRCDGNVTRTLPE